MTLLCTRQSLSRGYLSCGHTAQGEADAPTQALQHSEKLPEASKRNDGEGLSCPLLEHAKKIKLYQTKPRPAAHTVWNCQPQVIPCKTNLQAPSPVRITPFTSLLKKK